MANLGVLGAQDAECSSMIQFCVFAIVFQKWRCLCYEGRLEFGRSFIDGSMAGHANPAAGGLRSRLPEADNH